MEELDRELLAGLNSRDEAVRVRAARSMIAIGRTQSAELSHPVVQGFEAHRAAGNTGSTEKAVTCLGSIGIAFATGCVCWFGFIFTAMALSLIFPGSIPISLVLATGAWLWAFAAGSDRLVQGLARDHPGYKRAPSAFSEAHSLAAIRKLVQLLKANDIDVQEDAANALKPALPFLDAELSGLLPTSTVHAMASAAGSRNIPVRFRLELLNTLERMADERSAPGIASAMREGMWDSAIRDASGAALQSIQANKRNSALLRPAELPQSESLLRPAGSAAANDKSLLRPAS